MFAGVGLFSLPQPQGNNLASISMQLSESVLKRRCYIDLSGPLSGHLSRCMITGRVAVRSRRRPTAFPQAGEDLVFFPGWMMREGAFGCALGVFGSGEEAGSSLT